MPRIPTGTVTFVFTDIEGSTDLLHELGSEQYAEALDRHRRVVREACKRHGGVEVDTQGDAFFFAFPTAPGGLEAALEAQEALSIPVRMGIHTGTPLVAQEGYVGADVHKAARIAAAGHGGQVLLSSASAALLDTGSLRDLGEHRLKDLTAPERIYQMGDGTFPSLRTLHRTNLPVALTPFVGRKHELREIGELLTEGELRLLTLSGPGGTGKTRLALQSAADTSDRYPDGVFWVPLADLRDRALVLEQAAQALGARGELADHIADKRVLLLFDNFEHVIEAAAELTELLLSCPNLEVLVTSREVLGLPGEQTYPVPPLAPEDATELFSVRAHAATPEFEPDDAIPELCARLDNLPLALELAAARVRLLSPHQLLERLSTRLDLLKAGRSTDPRQQTLRATVEWSYELLGEEERALFSRLAVFRGGCTLDAAEVVCDADIATLQALVDKSLLRRSGERFSMLETIREYGLEKLGQSSTTEELRRRHAEYYLAQAEREEATTPVALRSPDTLARLLPDRDNFRAAFTWATAAEAEDLTVPIAVVGAWFSIPWREWRVMLETGLELAPRGSPNQRVELLGRAAAMAKETGDLDRAQELSNELLEISRLTRNARAEVSALANLGDIAAIEGDLDRARELYECEIEILDRLGDVQWIAAVRHALGELELSASRLDDAERLFEDALAAAHQYGYDRLAAKILHGRGDLELTRGRLARAAEAYQESARVARPYGESKQAVYCLAGLAAVAATEGKTARAGRLWGAAEAIAAEEGLPLPAVDWDRYEEAVTTLRSRVEFRAAETAGRQLSLDAALDEVLAP
jgi:predicted ATPase/class 3 adenylate cyclase